MISFAKVALRANNYSRLALGLYLRAFSSTSSPLFRCNSIDQIIRANVESDRISVEWQNGKKSEFHNVWLRDHCSCEKCFNYTTNQRKYDLLQLPLDIQPKEVQVMGDKLHITWPDNHITVYNNNWLLNHEYMTRSTEKKRGIVEPFLWDKQRITSIDLPKFTFQSVLADDKECYLLSKAIERFGFAFVDDTLTALTSINTLCSRVAGFVRQTNYGKLWEFSNEVMEHMDTAYTAERLEAHTDNTYFNDPSGLQLLHCIFHDGKGGESLLVDGFNVAETLKQNSFDAFQFLSTQKIPFHFKDESLHIKANGQVIELDPYCNDIRQIRFNMYDREILNCLAPNDVPKFYHAFKAMASIVRNPDNEFWFKLTPGKCMIMANWRVMHGRSAFTGLRTMQGCYGNKDDFQGQLRSKHEVYKNEIE